MQSEIDLLLKEYGRPDGTVTYTAFCKLVNEVFDQREEGLKALVLAQSHPVDIYIYIYIYCRILLQKRKRN